MYPVSLFERERYTVALFGGHGSFEDWLLFAKTKTGYGVRSIIVPPAAGKPGFQSVRDARQATLIVKDADGMNVQSGQAVAVRTKDCAAVTAYNPLTERLAVAHIGRHGLTPPRDCTACGFTTVSSLLGAVAPRGTDASQVEVYITGTICGQCYRFDQPGAAAVLDPFRARYSHAIVDGAGFDQVAVIKAECVGRGVMPERIHHDDLCTNEHPQLTSYRAGDTNSNTIVVIHH